MQMSSIDKLKYFIATIALIGIMSFGVKGLFQVLPHIVDDDLDRLVGCWREEDGNRGFRFYEPYSDINGDVVYYKGSRTYYGSYEWHEASNRIIITVTDDRNMEQSMSFEYLFMDYSHLVLTPLSASYNSIWLKKSVRAKKIEIVK